MSAGILARHVWLTTAQRPQAGIDMSLIYGAQNFAAPAQGVFQRESGMLGELLAAWTEGFPIYAKAAPHDELVAVRKVGEVLARSAASYALPQRGQLVAALAGNANNGETAEVGQGAGRELLSVGANPTVIDAQGELVGEARLVFNPAQSEQNAREDMASRANTGQTSVYEFDKDALDALIIEALAPAK